MTSECVRPATLDFFDNLRVDDLITFPLYFMHIIVILIFLVFCDYVANMNRFGQDWLLLQLREVLGHAINATVLNTTLDDENARDVLQARAGFNVSNETFYDDVTLETFVRRVLLPDPTARETDRAILTPTATALLGEWDDLHSTFRGCYAAGVFFFVGGILFNLLLITIYMRKTSYAVSFVSQRLWRSSLTSSLIASFGLGNGGYLNALTQDETGYSIVRRDSAASHIVWHGIPMVAVAGGALAALDCGHRPCDVDMRGS